MTSIETREIPTNTGMLKAIDLLVTNNKFSDVHFVFGKTKQQRLPAHQLLLALRSSEFAELFYGETSVSTSPTSKKKKKAALREIEITDITASAFEVMLNYIYTENLEKLKPNNALDVLKAAKKYKVEGLENACIQMISKSVVDASSVCSILSNAIKLDDSKLIQSAMQFIEQNIDQLVKPKQPQQQQQQQQQSPNIENIQNNLLVDQPFNDLTLDALTLILQNDKLCLSKEIDLFNATHRWSIFQYQRQLDETIQQQQQQQPFQLPSAEIKRKILGDRAIASIRYPLMTLEEIAQFVSPSGLLTDRQLVQLYDAFILNTPNLFNFPSKPRKPKEKTPPTPTDEKKDTKVETKKGNRLYVFVGACQQLKPIYRTSSAKAMLSAVFLALSLGVVLSAEVPASDDNHHHHDIPLQANFSLNDYLGQWYENYRTWNMPFEYGTDIQAFYSLRSDNQTVNVTNRQYNPWRKRWDSVEGYAFVKDPKEPARFVVKFYKLLPGGDYRVLSTDYNNVAVVYSEFDFGFLRTKYAWILGRTQNLTESTVDQAFDLLKERVGLDRRQFLKTPTGKAPSDD